MKLLEDVCSLPGVHGVTTDSRKVAPGIVFVAVKGSNHDGHASIADALHRGAAAVVAERAAEFPVSVPFVVVANARLAFAQCVRALHGTEARIKNMYAVTGTNGKTTCATILEQMFLSVGRRTGFIGTTGNRYAGSTRDTQYTTPHADALYELFRDMRVHGIDTVCMEVSSHALDQHRVWGLPFTGALFTNLTRDHLDYHHTMENYAKAKKRLFDDLHADSFAVLNGDSEWTPFMKRDCKAKLILTVGRDEGSVYTINTTELHVTGTAFSLTRRATTHNNLPEVIHLRTKLLGDFNVMNAALCAVAALADGMEGDAVVQALAKVKGPAGRMERYVLPNGALAIVDYAHTPDALESTLRVLRSLHRTSSANHKIHVVFGCGGDRDKGKRPDMGRIAGIYADVVWITTDNPRTENPADIARDIIGGIEGAALQRTEIVLDRATAIHTALSAAAPTDIVLIAGKGHEEYQVVGTERLRFSDAEHVRAFGGQ